MNSPRDDSTANETAVDSPELERLLKANYELFQKATACAKLAADADPAGLPVGDDYIDVLDQFDTALADRRVHLVREAARRYISTFDLARGARPADVAGQKLISAVAALNRKLKSVDEARAQLPPSERML
ncbi:hypothetical protein [Nonomuraea jabiensis]|uniref:hypothetical protein n=1 Tax=Nonomuraea jabiensis TaxID=882448 RepID=UPI003D752363